MPTTHGHAELVVIFTRIYDMNHPVSEVREVTCEVVCLPATCTHGKMHMSGALDTNYLPDLAEVPARTQIRLTACHGLSCQYHCLI